MSKPLPLTGGAYTARSVIASAQRSVNLYAESMPQAEGEPAPVAHYPTPGLRLLGTVGTGPVRAIRQATTGGIYVVSGNSVYSVDPTTWVGTSLGDVTHGLRTPVSMSDNGLDMLIVDGSANGWDINLAGNTMSTVSDPNAMFVGADRVDYLDTYFILNKPNTPQFYYSGSLAVTFDLLDFANKESYSDLLVTLIVARREIYLLGTKTTEIWYDQGAQGATDTTSQQFAPVQGVFIDHGCVAKYSVAEHDNSIFWLARNRQGQGVVMSAAGYQTKRISTYPIEAVLRGYARIDDAIGFCYQIAGHTFYVLSFPHADKTWCHDVGTGLWHEWVWLDTNGDEHRHRANCFWPVNDLLVVGDWQNGNLYALDQDVFEDNGQPIKRLRSYPHLLAAGARVFYREFVADMETGTAPGLVPGTLTLLQALFTAPDGTLLEDYTSDVGGGWTPVGGDAGTAEIEDDALVGTGGEALYQSAVVPPTPDYTARFRVVPSGYDTIATDTSLWIIGRATGADTGYRAMVSADSTQYTLSLDTLGVEGPSVSVVMGTLASGTYTVWLVLAGGNITVQVQRTEDAKWLRADATWQTSAGTVAASFTDTTYAAAGAIMIGGVWS